MVFISWASRNSKPPKAALDIREALDTARIRSFFSREDILPGSSFGDDIYDALTHCEVVVLVLTKECSTSKYVWKEITLANQLEKRVIVFKVEEVDLPGRMQVELAGSNWLDATEEYETRKHEFFIRVISAIQARVFTTITDPPPEKKPARPRRRILLGSAILVLVVAAGVTAYFWWTLNGIPPVEMVTIPAGEFLSGMDVDDVPEMLFDYSGWEMATQGGRRRIFLPAFAIDKYEVTNAEYARFVEKTGHVPPEYWKGAEPPVGKENHPVVNVSYNDAVAYATWTGKRLPSADEWEKAARGVDGNVYPWGATFEKHLTNTDGSGIEDTCPVDNYPLDKSPFGVIGMGGNAAEWTTTPKEGEGDSYRTICGGSWYDWGGVVSISSLRRYFDVTGKRPDITFRCAKSLK